MILVLAGVAQLAQNLIGPLPAILWAALFGFAGLCFPVYRRSPDNWWAIIPMLTLLGLALLVGLGETLGELAAALFFLAIAASFLVVYLTHRDKWWAIIPCLVLTGLAVMVGMAESAGALSASVLFVVCAAGFVFLRTRGIEFWWAVIPAGVMGSLAVLVPLAESQAEVAPAVLFFGLAVTFGLVWLLPGPVQHQRWPVIRAS